VSRQFSGDRTHGAITTGRHHDRRTSAGGSGGLGGILALSLQLDDQRFEPGGKEQLGDVGLQPVRATAGRRVQQNGDQGDQLIV
jgi:hypothetical protein